jgi:uncharacterized RDD family membrane protein YckC
MEQIVTGEAVVLDLPCARFPARALSRIIDMVVEVVLLNIILVLVLVAAGSENLDSATVAALLITGLVLVVIGYPVTFETLSRGRTLGKLALGLRVVADDGGPERFRHAFVRALVGFVECWLLVGVPALITSILSARGKRLGDVFAGTFVLRVRAPRAAPPSYVGGVTGPGFAPQWGAAMPGVTFIGPALRPWAASLDLSALPDSLAASAAGYLSRYWQLNDAPREALGRQLATDVAARVSPPPPPGLPPALFLHTVLAERHNRALARLMPWSRAQ